MKYSFAAFIMTYERPQILLKTISVLFEQTIAPQKILVVDNSLTEQTMRAIEQLNDNRIEYHRVGKNIGPAGASKIGLQKLTEQGYDWISWGDDDDPPHFKNVFEDLLKLADTIPNTGVVGAVGHAFNKNKGLVVRTNDKELDSEGCLEVDIIAGNVSMIVNAAVVKKGILPDPGFFLNVEEYDFCLRVKHAGFKVIVNRSVFKAYRTLKGRMGFNSRAAAVLPKKSVLWRRYYSTRNLIFLLTKSDRNLSGALHVSIRGLAKALAGFRKGIDYGMANAKMELRGILDGWKGKMGLTVLPNPKY